jgi:hypothetical protein
MATANEHPRSRLTEHTLVGEPDQASPHVPIGSYTDDPAANARHSADIADMMADRSEGHAQRSQHSADDAKHLADLAEIYCHTGEIHADRANNAAEHARFKAQHVGSEPAAASLLVFVSVLAGFLLAILAFLVAALICIKAGHVAHDTHGEPAPTHAAKTSDRLTVQPNLHGRWS